MLIPLLFWATNRYGAVGAAAIWITVNASYVLIGIQIMHTRLLRGEKRAWYSRDVGLPLIGALCTALIGRWLFPAHPSTLFTVVALMFVSLATLGVTGILTPLSRRWLQEHLLPRQFIQVQATDSSMPLPIISRGLGEKERES